MWVTDNLHTRRYFEGRTSSLNGNWVWCAVFKVKLILVTASSVNSSFVVLIVKVVAVAALFSPSFMQTKYDGSLLEDARACRAK